MGLKNLGKLSGKRRAEQEAAIWLVRLEEGLSSSEQQEYEAWLRLSPENWAASHRADTINRLLRELQTAGPDQQAERPSAGPAPRPRRRSGWRLVALSCTAAALLAGSFLLYRTSAPGLHEKEIEYVSDTKAPRKVKLSDGSEIELGRNSRVLVTYTPQQRHIVLTAGNARFSVAKDAQRPFVTLAERVSVQAVGTVFNVAVTPVGVEIYVTEGKVKVMKSVERDIQSDQLSPREMSVEFPNLAAGEGGIIPASVMDERSSSADLATDRIPVPEGMEWRLFFANTRMADVVSEFNRRNRVQIVIDDPSLFEREVGGNFRADQPEAFARLLQNGRDVIVDFSQPGIIILRKTR